ncbi:hypothetical protein AK812_SmicGene2835 [Symbiodinium microadriaticum]|uniref:Uncharacterized protein n=1 Tax=Symbiodinium microadriaticum TaxID=2951 RepID=A0A1Q9F0E8_SYMMI|nr:hypothetical protein AK812_SmicGene2835 [Symbiodinium microadriaticum]
MALGLLASSCSAGPSAPPRREAQGARKQHPSIENEEVDETVEVRRVSPEEEERRYWASMAGGLDLFSGVDPAEQADVKTSAKLTSVFCWPP